MLCVLSHQEIQLLKLPSKDNCSFSICLKSSSLFFFLTIHILYTVFLKIYKNIIHPVSKKLG